MAIGDPDPEVLSDLLHQWAWIPRNNSNDVTEDRGYYLSSSHENSDGDGMMNSDNVEESHVVYYRTEFKKVLQELIPRYTEISVQCKEIADPLFKPLFPLKHPADQKEIEALGALFP